MKINVFCFPRPREVAGGEVDHCEFVALPGICPLETCTEPFNMGWTGPP